MATMDLEDLAHQLLLQHEEIILELPLERQEAQKEQAELEEKVQRLDLREEVATQQDLADLADPADLTRATEVGDHMTLSRRQEDLTVLQDQVDQVTDPSLNLADLQEVAQVEVALADHLLEEGIKNR